jgi:hypothetical protein
MGKKIGTRRERGGMSVQPGEAPVDTLTKITKPALVKGSSP